MGKSESIDLRPDTQTHAKIESNRQPYTISAQRKVITTPDPVQSLANHRDKDIFSHMSNPKGNLKTHRYMTQPVVVPTPREARASRSSYGDGIILANTGSNTDLDGDLVGLPFNNTLHKTPASPLLDPTGSGGLSQTKLKARNISENQCHKDKPVFR